MQVLLDTVLHECYLLWVTYLDGKVTTGDCFIISVDSSGYRSNPVDIIIGG